jgi:hypothetical protein
MRFRPHSPGNAVTFDLFDRNDAVALTGRWRATAWRRWRC